MRTGIVLDSHTRFAGWELLHPKARDSFEGLSESLTRAYESGQTQTLFKVFETFRGPLRQLDLFAKGTTKARAWQSAHNYGLAVDFVPFVPLSTNRAVGEWSWASHHDYEFLATRASVFGLVVPISWDPCHVESPIWGSIRKFVI